MSHIPTPVAVGEGGTGASSASTARTNLGLGTIATQAANSVSITGGTITGITDLSVADGGTGASTLTGYVKGAGTSALTASATIPNTDITGLGTMSTQAASNVAITGGSIAGITDLALADGGTGASTAANARTNLGVTATGSDTTYAYRANNLSDLASAPSARSNLGLGTLSTQNASSVSISGGSITGITDLAVADGGTGASDAGTARSNLGLGSMATQNSNNVNISGGTVAAATVSGNISGTAAGVTGYTINQSVGTSNLPTFAGVSVTSPIRHSLTTNIGITGAGNVFSIGGPVCLVYSTGGTPGIAGITSNNGFGNSDGMVQYVVNTDISNNIQLEHDSSAATATSRILCPGGVAYTIAPLTGVCLVYITASGTSRWLVVQG